MMMNIDNVDKEDDIINLGEDKNKYKSLNELLNYTQENNHTDADYLKQMLEKIQKLSLFIKKVKLAEDLKYLQSQSKDFSKILKLTKTKIENIILKTFLYINKDKVTKEDFKISDFKCVTDFVDDLLEKVSDNIDIIKGKKKDKRESEIENELKNLKNRKFVKGQTSLENFHLKSKIQLSLEDQFDIDNSYFPFIPKILSKPFAVKELTGDIADARRLRSENLEKFRAIRFEDRKENREMTLFEHPYKEEICEFTNKLASRIEEYTDTLKRKKVVLSSQNQDSKINLAKLVKFEKISIGDFTSETKDKRNIKLEEIKTGMKRINERKVNGYNRFFMKEELDEEYISNASVDKMNTMTLYEIEHLPLDQTKFTYIDTKESFLQMINEVETYAEEIAVDLEHHSLESYLGLTCLMQLSTRFADYVIDTIKLRPFIQEINRLFCNPKIIKILHGADYDVEWLQKDFGVYIVNMFDTGQASRVLQLPSFSLANLLSTICNISADKKYQLADWRIRPIPAEMLKYAREDTHYLLYIYDHLRRKLIEKSLMREDFGTSLLFVCKKSNELALKQYVKPSVKSMEYYQMRSRNSGCYNKRQISLLKLVFKFRDFVARRLDLSPHQVLTQRNLFNLVKLPKFDAESVYMNLESNANIRNYVPDLIKLVEEKMIRNEKKIDEGNSAKMLETSYLNDVRGKLNMSRNYVNDLDMKIKKITRVSMNVATLPMKENKASLKDSKSFGENVVFNQMEKKKSKFFGEERNDKNNEKKFDKDKDNEYESVLEKLNNFNIISFLQEKHPLLKVESRSGVKTKPVAYVAPGVPVQQQQLQQVIHISSSSTEEKFLKQKRKGDHSDMLDLTDYKRPFTQTSNNDSDSDEEEQILLTPTSSKNMQASENFMKNLLKMKKSGKK